MEFDAKLILDDGTEHALRETLTVGRSDECDITLPSSKVSRRHARFTVADGGVTVEDLGSSNGTRLNGRAIGSTQSLMDGDCVSVDTFNLTVAISSASADHDDATVIAPPPDDDATVLAPAGTAETPPATDKPSPTAAGKPDSPPAEKPGPSPVEPASQPSGELPGSWVDSGTGESTQFLSPGAVAPGRQDVGDMPRHSALAHFVVVAADGSASDVFELETGGGEEDTWELGRESSCDIQLEDPTVSARHAQLVHRSGRWRMVNLISSNGIVVNGEKRLSVYLDDGDSVQLGEMTLVFHAPEGAAAVKPAAAARAGGDGSQRGSRTPLYIGIGVLLVLVVVAAFTLL